MAEGFMPQGEIMTKLQHINLQATKHKKQSTIRQCLLMLLVVALFSSPMIIF